MFIRRTARKRLSTWMVGVFLLTQWLVAAYACPAIVPATGSTHGAAAAHEAQADCHGKQAADMDTGYPTLCKAHCDGDPQVPTQGSSHDVTAPLAGGFIAPPSVCAEAGTLVAVRSVPPRSGAPPGWPALYLINRVLRN